MSPAGQIVTNLIHDKVNLDNFISEFIALTVRHEEDPIFQVNIASLRGLTRLLEESFAHRPKLSLGRCPS